MDIPKWNDAGVREVVQGNTGPFYIAAAHKTKLDEIATETLQAHPDEIARLGYTVARKINPDLPDINSSEEINKLAESISSVLLNAKKPLIVAGTGLFSQPVIEAAANIAFALTEKEKDAGLFYVVPEVNSVGLVSISEQFLENAFEKVKPDNEKTLVILENDIYRRTDKNSTDSLFQKAKNTIVLDYLENETTKHANFILPAGTFAEASGTVINNEGRAQRFYQVHVPANEIKSSWKWLQEIVSENSNISGLHLDGIVTQLAKTFPHLKEIQSVAPPADYKKGTQKIPRESHRYSGRTAIHANENVNEPKPPEDSDSPMTFTMEGYTGIPPSELTSYYWSPGWNSVQAINKYQIEVGGKLHGGNPGKRLFDSKNNKTDYFKMVPQPFKPKKGEWVVLPLYHIFGTDELSAQSQAVAERVPKAYIALNNTDALEAGIEENDKVEIFAGEKELQLPVKLNTGIVKGIVGLPKELDETRGIQFPFRTTINKVKHE
jgi:NADH-quinone oxidoreductase subunit G